MSGAHGNRPETLHEGNRKVTADALPSQHDPQVLRMNSQALLPRAGCQQRAVVVDQPLVRRSSLPRVRGRDAQGRRHAPLRPDSL
jgi:hypothetical protein